MGTRSEEEPGKGFDAFTDLLDYPVYVVTAAAAGARAGCLVGFASQCSISPPRFMVWLSTANRTYRVARDADHLAVHLLPPDHGLAELFGGRTGEEVDKFAAVDWDAGPAGAVLLRAAPAWFVGRVVGRSDGGDHVGFRLAPVAAGRGPRARPMSFREVRDIRAGHPA
ncbi:flavin oxidoreductase [Kitasatospora sp. MMS16-BH015]|uniref:flavin reductase family protein n=1 Tax=Kitasatospora sp. MMS16-BH015 TaxID=2018025 RepID=UPI000CA21130|nr:flavin reductase family protein [Kitasatospora sp. MMS16-BH015]AUG80456.1 flavin oxidoreductase [Kitasatospora sp. MMS16-BH015]